MKTLSAMRTLVCLLLCACGAVSDLHDLARDAATLRGRASAGAAVAVVDASGAVRARTLADVGGAFTVAVQPPGRLTVVVNDLAGRGAVRAVDVLGGASLDLGELGSAPLESFPALFDLRGLGYEERLSRDDGNHSSAAFSSDARKVYTLRGLPHTDTVELVETATGDGSARVLRAAETVGGFRTFGEDALPSLFADRFLVMLWQRPTGSAGALQDTWVALDVTSGAEVAIPNTSATHYSGDGARPVPYLADSPSFALADDGSPYLVYTVLVGTTRDMTGSSSVLEVCGLSLQAGAASRRCFLAPGATTRIEWRGTHAQMRSQGAVYRADLAAAAPQPEMMNLLGYQADDALWRERGTLFALRGPSYGLLAIGDGDGGDLREVLHVGDQPLTQLTANDAFTTALFKLGSGSAQNVTHRADLVRGELAALPTSLEVAGEAMPVRYWCEYASRWRSARAAGADDYGRCFDGDGATGVVWARLQATTEQCARLGGPSCTQYGLPVRHQLGSTTAVPRLEVPEVGPAAGLQALIERDGATGHQQLALQGPDAAPRQATFLTADHEAPAFSQDGSTLFYFTRDPVRGYVGLFRLDVASLTSLWRGSAH